MRLAGTFADQHDAATFVDYLLTLGIDAKVERNGDQWDLWVLDEERVAESKTALTAFRENPRDEKYRAAVKEADRLRRERVDKVLAARRNVIAIPRSVGAGLPARRRPITTLLFIASAFVFAMSDFGKKPDVVERLQITEIVRLDDGFVGYDAALPEIRRGEAWRLLTPMFLHFSILHFLGNMFWLFEFGSQIEARRGSFVLATLVVLADVVGNLGQFYWSGPSFGGMSGVNFALFGYVWIKARYEPWSGFMLQQNTVVFMIVWFFLCMAGIVGNVANVVHLGGLVCGVVFAYLPTLFRRGGGPS